MAKLKVEPIRWTYEFPEVPTLSSVPELMMLGYDRFHEASPLNDHRHERSYEFVVVESGKVTWEVDGSLYPFHTGQCFHTRPGEWHRARPISLNPAAFGGLSYPILPRRPAG